jgi:DHA3 family macrolide efflux protein-like MFS transporter
MTTVRTYYTIITTQILSMIGSVMSSFAIGIWVFAETGDTTPLLLVGVFKWLPFMLFGSVAGVLADRFNRKSLIIGADAAQAIPTLLLLISFSAGTFALWQLYLAALIQSLFGMVQSPAMQASITMLVPDEGRDRANAVMQIAGPSARMLAPVVAGFLYAFVSVEGILAIDLITFLIAVAVISQVHIPQPAETAESKASRGSIWHELRGGFTFLYSRRGLFVLSFYFLFLNFITAGVWVLLSPYMLVLTDFNEPLVGILMGVSSFGLVTGGLVPIVWRVPRPRIHTILITLALAAVGLMLFGTVRSTVALGVVVFLMMLPYKMTNALLSSIKQSKIPPDMQGRVYGLTGQISILAQPIALLLTGPLVDDLLEPMVGTSRWRVFAPIFGNEAGAGMGLYIATCGLFLFIATLLVYALPIVRHLEHDLPDYKAVSEKEIMGQDGKLVEATA